VTVQSCVGACVCIRLESEHLGRAVPPGSQLTTAGVSVCLFICEALFSVLIKCERERVCMLRVWHWRSTNKHQ